MPGRILLILLILGSILDLTAANLGQATRRSQRRDQGRPAAATQAKLEPWKGKCVGITDGDTVKVLRDGVSIRIRLHGIDAPEAGQPFGRRARELVGELVFNQTVSVRPIEFDRYRRVVAEVILPDGRSLNREIIRAGMAWWYRKYAATDAELKRLEAEARGARRGLWADHEPVAPWEWRRRVRAARRQLKDPASQCCRSK